MGVLLDVAVGLAVLFLGFAVVVTAAVELGSRVVGWRSANLWSWMRRAVGATSDQASGTRKARDASKAAAKDSAFLLGIGARWSGGDTDRADELKREIRALTMRTRGRINAVSKRDFGRAVLNLVLPQNDSTIDDAIAEVEGWPDSVPMKPALLRILGESEGRREVVVDRVGDWFDEQMGRISAVYSRYMRAVSIGCGLVLAVIFNLNALNAYDVLERDAVLREAGVAAGQAIAKECNLDTGDTDDADTGVGAEPEEPAGEGSDTDTDGDSQASEDPVTCVRTTADALFRSNELVDRWGLWDDDVIETRYLQTGWRIPLGLATSGVAIGFGAPFWLDTIKRITRGKA